MKWGALFARLCSAARDNERCPTNGELGSGAGFSYLARAGYIRVNVYRKNYRVVDILKGPQKGLSTADAPDRRPDDKPYKVVDIGAPALRSGIVPANRQEPWKPGEPRPRRA